MSADVPPLSETKLERPDPDSDAEVVLDDFPDHHIITRRHRIVALLLTFIWVPLLGLVLLEVYFNLFVNVTDVLFGFWDPLLGPRLIPNQSGRFIISKDIDAHYHFNAQGWNHPDDYVFDKPPGSLRVALIGDSMVEALQVDTEKSMTALAAARMNRPERPAQWYSFANSGWGPTHEYLVIRHYALSYHPDVVILLFVQNDPTDTSPYMTTIPSHEPKMYLGENGELRQVAASYMPPVWRGKLAGKFALFRYFGIQKGLWKIWIKGPGRGGAARWPLISWMDPLWDRLRGKAPTQPTPEAVPLPVQSDRLPSPDGSSEESARKTWLLVEKTFEAMRDECHSRGAIFAVAYTGHHAYLNALLAGKAYKAPPKEVDPYDLRERIDEMGKDFVEPISQRLGIPYLDLTATLAAMIRKTGRSHHFIVDSHYNATAHAAVAEALADWTESLLKGESRRGTNRALQTTASPRASEAKR
jgi:hypothetical protein